MKKLLLLFLLGFALAAGAQSTSKATMLVIEQTNGQNPAFKLTDLPVMTIEGDNCVFTTKDVTLTVPMADFSYYHFMPEGEYVPTAIEEPETDNIYAELIAPGVVLVKGVDPRDICVFDINGRAVRAEVSGTRDSLTVSVADLVPGVYILRFAIYSLKFTNK